MPVAVGGVPSTSGDGRKRRAESGVEVRHCGIAAWFSSATEPSGFLMQRTFATSAWCPAGCDGRAWADSEDVARRAMSGKTVCAAAVIDGQASVAAEAMLYFGGISTFLQTRSGCKRGCRRTCRLTGAWKAMICGARRPMPRNKKKDSGR